MIVAGSELEEGGNQYTMGSITNNTACSKDEFECVLKIGGLVVGSVTESDMAKIRKEKD